jgi:pyrimidine-specific ribonucleoside hydrolase
MKFIRSGMIKKRYIALSALVLLCLFPPLAHAHIYKTSILVDTDMALDDIRAISMLLNSEMVDIPLIATSDGALSPQEGCKNLAMLLRYFKREEVRIAEGRVLGKPAPPWRSWCEDPKWPEIDVAAYKIAMGGPAAEETVKTLQFQDKPILYLCLGPLTNLADALRLSPGVKYKISRLVYFGAHPDDPFPGWNTNRDPESARFVFDSRLEISCVVLPEKKLLPFDQLLYKEIQDMDTTPARLVASIHRSPTIRRLLSEGRLYVWDEMTVIYLNEPSLFRFVPTAHGSDVMSLASFKAAGVHDTYLKLLGHIADFHLSPRHPVVLKGFPSDPSLFREDVKPYVRRIIEKYGLEEWKACLLTNEFHRHLGTYSLIGAKMGIRAREVLEAPFDAMRVVSFAGTSPPLSCMNDGLQVATGASLGRGTIQIPDQKPQPAAIFFYKNHKLTLKIKKELLDRIRADIEAAEKAHGGLNPAYFAHFRKLSLDYWHDLDRKKIFDEFIE